MIKLFFSVIKNGHEDAPLKRRVLAKLNKKWCRIFLKNEKNIYDVLVWRMEIMIRYNLQKKSVEKWHSEFKK